MLYAWGTWGALAAADIVWFPFSRLSFAPGSLWRVLPPLLILGVMCCVGWAVRYRVRNDPSKPAAVIRWIVKGLYFLVYAVLFSIAGYVLIVFIYLSVTVALPLQDARFAALDQSLGFDWQSFVGTLNSSPAVAAVLVWAYHSAGQQLAGVLLLLSFTHRIERLNEFLALNALTVAVTALIGFLVPAIGPTVYYEVDPNLFSNFGPHSGTWHYEAFLKLRTEASPVLDFSKIAGLVEFPSFHTILAILTVYAVRGFRFIFWPVLVLNVIVIVSTIPEGGHYLVDVIAGAAIAAAAILFVRRQQGSWRLSAKRAYAPVAAATSLRRES
jgi:membrane-associated phospholipid phosphatase